MSWQRVRGHDLLVKSFADVVARGRLGHAYLFVGPSGVGKRLFALELAKALLCETKGTSFDGCDRCSSCSLVDAGTHPDVICAGKPEDKNEFPIDLMRQLNEKLALKPARGGHKIAILDDVDDFNDESANAFLKTLEEPPPKSLLILLGTDPFRQLPTIVSRCQLVRFAPLPTLLVAELLGEQGVEPDRAARLARISGGSLGQAQDLADESLWTFRSELLQEIARPRPDTVRLAARWMSFLEQTGKDGPTMRRRAALTTHLVVELLHQALNISAGGAGLGVEPSERPLVAAFADRLGTERLLALVDRSLEGEHHLDRFVQLVLAVEALADAFATS